MNIQDYWDSEDHLIDYLASLMLNGRLALFLGAGTSKFYDLPDWKTLIDKLYLMHGGTKPNGNLKIAAEELRNNYYPSNKSNFLKAVHQALYANASGDFEIIRTNRTLTAIAALVMASSRGKIGKVITLNYDNILELYLMYHGFLTASVHNPIHWNSSADVTVFHPHGFLPFGHDQDQNFSEDIIFDQHSYSQLVNDLTNPWFQEISTILRTHFTFYIGLSGDDDNLERMLVLAREQHAICQDGVLFCGLRFSQDDNRIEFFKRRGIYTFKVTQYDNDVPIFLLKICQKAAEKRSAI